MAKGIAWGGSRAAYAAGTLVPAVGLLGLPLERAEQEMNEVEALWAEQEAKRQTGRGTSAIKGSLSYSHFSGWQEASLSEAIMRFGGENPRRFVRGDKFIYENRQTGTQIVIDKTRWKQGGEGYFTIFQPDTPGSKKGTYLTPEGEIPTIRRRVKGGAIRDVDVRSLPGGKAVHRQRTHFRIRGR
jgi:hypothetical protein